MDLPSDDRSATFDTYADVVCGELNGHDDVVLVGHSLAGLTIPLVAARLPVRHLVYVCALIPDIGRSFFDQMRGDTAMLNPDYSVGLGASEEDCRAWVDDEAARRHLFGDCDETTAKAAIAQLRPQALLPYRMPYSLDAHPVVASTYVLCTDDLIVNPEWSRRVARERLGAELTQLPGSHSPFLSRPQALADVLLRTIRASAGRPAPADFTDTYRRSAGTLEV